MMILVTELPVLWCGIRICVVCSTYSVTGVPQGTGACTVRGGATHVRHDEHENFIIIFSSSTTEILFLDETKTRCTFTQLHRSEFKPLLLYAPAYYSPSSSNRGGLVACALVLLLLGRRPVLFLARRSLKKVGGRRGYYPLSVLS